MNAKNQRQSHSWEVVGASVTGTSHNLAGQPGQDRFLYRTWRFESGESLTVIVCADGAGSAGRSWAGAWMACRTVTEYMNASMLSPARQRRMLSPEFDDRAFFVTMIESVRRRLTYWSKRLNTTFPAMATTLNVAVLKRDGALFAQIGDGLIGFQTTHDSQNWRMVQRIQAGEFVGETTFLTSPDWRDRLIVETVHEPLCRVVVSTDGLLPILFHSQSETIHAPFLEPLYRAVQSGNHSPEDRAELLRKFLTGQRVTARCEDDLTLILCSLPTPEVDETGNES